eukprot:s4573_g5.t1
MKISVGRLSLLLSCLPASLCVQPSALTACDDDAGLSGNLLLQTYASALVKPWDRRNYLVGTSHKAGSHLLRTLDPSADRNALGVGV